MEPDTSGLRPLEFNVIVRQDEVDEKTKGGVFLPQTVREREEYAAVHGVIVSVAPLAFNEDICIGPKPAPGDRVIFARHAGAFLTGADGRRYRAIKDKDVIAILEKTDGK